MASFDRTAPLILVGNESSYVFQRDRDAVLFILPGGHEGLVRIYRRVPGTDTAMYVRTVSEKQAREVLIPTGRYVTWFMKNCPHADYDCEGTCYDCGQIGATRGVGSYL